MKKIKFVQFISFLMIGLAFVITTCAIEGAQVPVVNAAEPVINDHPAGYQELSPGATLRLEVSADSPDGGELSFQWYSMTDDPAGVPLENEDWVDVEITLAAEGIYHFFVVVTNSKPNVNGRKTASIRSGISTVIVNPGTGVHYPNITGHPAGGTKVVGDGSIPLTAEVAISGNGLGTLSYQWYSSNNPISSGGSVIGGATSKTFDFTPDTPGTFYFYLVVTNTIDEESKTATSRFATVVALAELNPNATIALNPNRKYQYVRGYGGMDIPWANFFEISEAEYELMFDPDTGLGYNIMRIMIMPDNPVDATDINETMKYYVEGEGGRPLYYEGVKIVNKYDGYVLASPWSPPAVWKTNNSINGGGHLIPGYYEHYAEYLKAFCQNMFDNGAPIYAVSIQNEPNYLASYDGCEWTPEEMMDFHIRTGHFTEGVKGWGAGKEIPRVLVMSGESANHPRINDAALNNPISRQYIDLIGRHTYGDFQVRYTNALNHPDFPNDPKEVWMSEHNINSGNEASYVNDSTWNYVWAFMNDVDLSIRLNDESAFIWWALKRFYSMIGEGRFGTTEGVVLPRGYGMSHYAKFSKETWRIGVSIQGTLADRRTPITSTNVNNGTFDRNSVAAKITAFISDDGNELSLVMYTPTSTSGARGVDLGTVKIQLPQGFVATKAEAIRSTSSVKVKPEDVLLTEGGTVAFIMLPPSNIVSVRFTK